MTTFLKENFDLILLFIGVLGLVIAVISLAVEVNKRKNK